MKTSELNELAQDAIELLWYMKLDPTPQHVLGWRKAAEELYQRLEFYWAQQHNREIIENASHSTVR